MERGRFYQQFGETSGSGETGSAANAFNAFVERLAPTGERTQRQDTGLQRVHPFDPFNLMRKFHSSYERKQWNELGFQPTDEQYTMVRNVELAYGIIAHPFCEEQVSFGEKSPIYQDAIVQEIGFDQKFNGNNRVVLTDGERDILVKIAQSAGMPCDPERKVYFYDEIPHATWLDKIQAPTPNVVDADK